MEKSIAYLDQILKEIKVQNEVRVRKLFGIIETDEEHKKKGWALLSNPDSNFFNAVHFLEEEGYLISYNLDTSGDRTVRLHYKAILLLYKGGFVAEYEKEKERWKTERIFKYGMPAATLLAVLASLFID